MLWTDKHFKTSILRLTPAHIDLYISISQINTRINVYAPTLSTVKFRILSVFAHSVNSEPVHAWYQHPSCVIRSQVESSKPISVHLTLQCAWRDHL